MKKKATTKKKESSCKEDKMSNSEYIAYELKEAGRTKDKKDKKKKKMDS